MKVTSFVFGIGGVALGEELQKDVIAENKVSWKERLTADSAIGFLFAMFGYYIHVCLPCMIVVVPLFAAVHDYSNI